MVEQVATSINRFGPRYLERVYTACELLDCAADQPQVRATRLAARFAVKEAVTKVLAPDDASGWWRDIETVRALSGSSSLRLTGTAERRADQAGIAEWSTSISHEGDYAVAVVIGWQAPAIRKPHPAVNPGSHAFWHRDVNNEGMI